MSVQIMMVQIRIFSCAAITALAGISVWWIIMMLLGLHNFKRDGDRWIRRFPMRGADEEIRADEIKYHNEAIYGDFAFFFKVALPILGGTAYIVTQEKVFSVDAAKLIIQVGGWIQVLAGCLFALFITIHQKSKVERWPIRFSFWGPVTWQECWMVVGILVISITFGIAVVPELIGFL